MQFRSQTQTAAVGDAQGAVVVQSVTMATHRHWTPSSHGPPTFNPPVHGDPAAGQHRPMPSQKHWSLITRLSPWIVFPPSPVWSFAFHATLPNPVQLDFRLPPTLSARPSHEPASTFLQDTVRCRLLEYRANSTIFWSWTSVWIFFVLVISV